MVFLENYFKKVDFAKKSEEDNFNKRQVCKIVNHYSLMVPIGNALGYHHKDIFYKLFDLHY